MGRLKPIIKPFDSGWSYILYLFFKLISLLVIWSWECNNALKKKITSLPTSVTQVCPSALDVFLGESLNLQFENTKIIAKQTREQEDLHTCFVHVRSHNSMYVIINLERITDGTLSGTITHRINPH